MSVVPEQRVSGYQHEAGDVIRLTDPATLLDDLTAIVITATVEYPDGQE